MIFSKLRRPSTSLRRPFQSLSVPNYRRYFTGQVISISGTWMQTIGEMWLVLRLTNSPTAVGITTALQFTPVLLAGAWGGVLADRMSKRRLLAWTQSLMALPALTLWMLTTTGHVTVLVVYALVFVRGSVNAIDNPARQSFVMELVGRERVVNAVSLNSLIVQSARIIGPALAGIVIASVGIAPCFLLNSLSFGAMLIALWRINPGELQPAERTNREPGQLREALLYVRRTPELSVPARRDGDRRHAVLQLPDDPAADGALCVRWVGRHVRRAHLGHGGRRRRRSAYGGHTAPRRP